MSRRKWLKTPLTFSNPASHSSFLFLRNPGLNHVETGAILVLSLKYNIVATKNVDKIKIKEKTP